MHYYEADDLTFQKLRAAGKHAWDEQSDPEASFENFLMRPFLEESLAGLTRPLAGLHALEIGCGTGPISCFLASRGLAVRGIDVSPTAVEMARQHAAERGLGVQFQVADICNLPAPGEQYDWIVDGHCLHYLVWEEDRQKALAAVHRMLKPDGVFLVETMVSHPGMAIGEKYRLDNRGVLWLRVDDPADLADVAKLGGEWFLPYRRILQPEGVESELRAAGFVIHFQRAVEQKGSGKPMLMQVRCERR
jgi:SAM-dependent methyltransferase